MRFFGDMLVRFSLQYLGRGTRDDGTEYVELGIPEIGLKVKLDMVEGTEKCGTIDVPLAYGSDPDMREIYQANIRDRITLEDGETDRRIITPEFGGPKQ